MRNPIFLLEPIFNLLTMSRTTVTATRQSESENVRKKFSARWDDAPLEVKTVPAEIAECLLGGSRGAKTKILYPLYLLPGRLIREESKGAYGRWHRVFRNERAGCVKFTITGVWQVRFFARPVSKFYTVGIIDSHA